MNLIIFHVILILSGVFFSRSNLIYTPSFDSYFLSPGYPAPDGTQFNNTNIFFHSLADVNGDGIDDLIAMGTAYLYVSISTGTSLEVPSEWSTNFTLNRGWNDFKKYPIYFRDLNGDGMEDAFGFDWWSLWVSMSNGASFGPLELWCSVCFTNEALNLAYVKLLGDVNGDGRADLILLNSSTIEMYFTSMGGQAKSTINDNEFSITGGFPNYEQYPRFVADVNGDGYEDLIGFSVENPGVYVKYSKGNSYTPKIWMPSNFGSLINSNQSYLQGPRYITDIDGDGKADLLYFGQDGVYVEISHGYIFGESTLLLNYSQVNGSYLSNLNSIKVIGDVNGDKKDDIVAITQNGQGIKVFLSEMSHPVLDLKCELCSASNLSCNPCIDRAVYLVNGDLGCPPGTIINNGTHLCESLPIILELSIQMNHSLCNEIIIEATPVADDISYYSEIYYNWSVVSNSSNELLFTLFTDNITQQSSEVLYIPMLYLEENVEYNFTCFFLDPLKNIISKTLTFSNKNHSIIPKFLNSNEILSITKRNDPIYLNLKFVSPPCGDYGVVWTQSSGSLIDSNDLSINQETLIIHPCGTQPGTSYYFEALFYRIELPFINETMRFKVNVADDPINFLACSPNQTYYGCISELNCSLTPNVTLQSISPKFGIYMLEFDLKMNITVEDFNKYILITLPQSLPSDYTIYFSQLSGNSFGFQIVPISELPAQNFSINFTRPELFKSFESISINTTYLIGSLSSLSISCPAYCELCKTIVTCQKCIYGYELTNGICYKIIQKPPELSFTQNTVSPNELYLVFSEPMKIGIENFRRITSLKFEDANLNISYKIDNISDTTFSIKIINQQEIKSQTLTAIFSNNSLLLSYKDLFYPNSQISLRLKYIPSAELSNSISQITGTLNDGSYYIMILTMNPMLLWMIITNLQPYYYILFYNVDLPINLNNIMSVFDIARLNFFPDIGLSPQTVNHIDSPKKFEDQQIDGYFLNNAMSPILSLITMFLIYCILCFLDHYLRKVPVPIRLMFSKLLKILNKPFFLNLWLGMYLDQTLMATLQLRLMTINTFDNGFSLLVAIMVYFFNIHLLILIKRHVSSNCEDLKDTFFREILSQYRSKHRFMFFYSILSKFLIGNIIVIFYDFPVLQIWSSIAVYLIYIILCLKYQPTYDKIKNFMLIFNETMMAATRVLLFVIHQMNMDGTDADQVIRVGWMIVWLGVTNLVVLILMNLKLNKLVDLVYKKCHDLNNGKRTKNKISRSKRIKDFNRDIKRNIFVS